MGMNFCIAICVFQTKNVRVLGTRYKSTVNVEGAFANLSCNQKFDKIRKSS